MASFSELGLASGVTTALKALGFEQATNAQSQAIPLLASGRDLILQSETGTGKTFAYLAPIFSRILEEKGAKATIALVICPTQELAVQVARQAERLRDAASLPITVASILGGSPLSRQESALKKNPAIVVGTPGRLADLARMRALRLDRLLFLVLDEADRLFSKEYRSSTEELLSGASGRAAKVLASATIGAATRQAAAAFLREPASVDLLSEGVLARDIEHWVFYVEHRKRIDFVRKFDRAVKPERCLVFVSSADRVARTIALLGAGGFPIASATARQDKEHRRVALERFAKGSVRYLVTTDLGARGLDIPSVSHVLSLDFPQDGSWYIHRAGRTGRAGAPGVSVALADGMELPRASKLAVERGFVFRTKRIAEGAVVEPPVEEFFAAVEKGEAERLRYRESRKGRDRR